MTAFCSDTVWQQLFSGFLLTHPIYFQLHYLNFSVIIILKKIVDVKNSDIAISVSVFLISAGNLYSLMKYSVVSHRYNRHNRPMFLMEAMALSCNGDCSDMLFRHSITKHVLHNLYGTERINKFIWLRSYNVITDKNLLINC